MSGDSVMNIKKKRARSDRDSEDSEDEKKRCLRPDYEAKKKRACSDRDSEDEKKRCLRSDYVDERQSASRRPRMKRCNCKL